MIAHAKSSSSTDAIPAWQDQFVRTILPVVEQNAEFHFRRLARDAREEAVAEAVAAAVTSCASLVARGKDPTRFPSRIAEYAVLHVRNGRHVGGHAASNDLMSVARREYFVRALKLLDEESDREEAGWREVLVEDRHASPADTAASRIDFDAWLQELPARERKLALRLADGHTTGVVARLFRLSEGRVSQLRRWFHRRWLTFQGQVPAAENELPAAA